MLQKQNIIVRSKPSEIQKQLSPRSHFLVSFIKNDFTRMNSLNFKEDKPLSDLIEWRYKNHKNFTK